MSSVSDENCRPTGSETLASKEEESPLVDEGEAVHALRIFLDHCMSTFQEARRCECPCCGASRSIYCYDCCEVLLDKTERPEGLDDVRLPFSVDIILDDRRAVATGVQAASVLKQISNSSNTQDNVYRLLDQADPNAAGIPDYSVMEGAYFLFPSEASVPVSRVATKIRHLVVLDCKWTKSNLRKDPRLLALPKVHLDQDQTPPESFFWRWHNSGKGMLSTIEALYFAAWQVAEQKKWPLQERHPLVNLLWVFGVQRALIRRKYESGRTHSVIPHLPFTQDGKECARKLRKRAHVESTKKHPDSSLS